MTRIGFLKKMLAVGLIGGSVIFAVLIVTDSGSVQKASIASVYQAGNLSPSTNSEQVPVLPSAPAKNITLEIAEKISQEIPSPGIGSLKDLQSPKAIADEYIAKALKDFNYEAFKPEVDVSRLQINPSSNKTAIAIYLKKLNGILETFSGLQFSADNPSQNLALLTKAYNDSIAALYTIPVPQIFSNLHTKVIAILSGQKSATEIIQNYKTDPLKALLSFQAITKLSEELTAVQRAISALANTNS